MAGHKYAVNEEGVEALRTVAQAIDDAGEQIKYRSDNMLSISQEYEETLGPNKKALDEILEEIIHLVTTAVDTTAAIGERLREAADDYEDEIHTSGYTR